MQFLVRLRKLKALLGSSENLPPRRIVEGDKGPRLKIDRCIDYEAWHRPSMNLRALVRAFAQVPEATFVQIDPSR